MPAITTTNSGILLGSRVTDSITGFTGIATGRAIYLVGPDCIQVTAKCNDNHPAESLWLEEDRLIASVRDLQCMKEGILQQDHSVDRQQQQLPEVCDGDSC